MPSISAVSNLFGIKNWFHGRQFFHGLAGGGEGLGIIQAHYTYCVLSFYYYYISSTSDHQALDPGGRGPLFCIIMDYLISTTIGVER